MSETRFLPSWLTKIEDDDDFFHFITFLLLIERLGGENLYGEGLWVYKELISQVGHGWDN